MPKRVNAGAEMVGLEMDRIWRPVFDKYDLDHDGRIAVWDFKRILKEGNHHLSEDLPDEVLDEIIERADWTKENYIDFEEFLAMINARDLGCQRPRVQRLIRYAAMAVVPRSQRQSTIRRYIEEYNCMPPPVFLFTITIIEIAIYVYYCVKANEFSSIGPVPWQSILIYDPCRRNQAWRFVSYMFIHAGFIHVFFNIIIQLLLGIPLEMVHKWWRVCLVYVVGVTAGSLASSITDPHTFLAGASGGVYALIAAHLANVTINWSEMEFRWVRLIALFVFGGSDVGVAIYGRYVTNVQTKTSYAAHLAGAIAGFLLGVFALKNLKVRGWEKVIGWCAFVILILLFGFAITFNILNEKYFIDVEHPTRCDQLNAYTNSYSDSKTGNFPNFDN